MQKKYTKKQSVMQKEYLESLANLIIQYVKQYNIHVLRYDSKSTESIYLKFDYGLAGSLRISAHEGYENLKYTFNLIKGLLNPYKESIRENNNLIHRYYYPDAYVLNLAQDIIRYKQYRIDKYGKIKYKNIMEHKAKYTAQKMNQPEKQKNRKSFWNLCKEA